MSAVPCCPVVELRQYTLRPGQRDVLIELFDREFVESQELAGMQIIGQFRDLDRPDRFVWLRGFADMEARKTALESFYGGPVWKAHREAANATMIDVDDVLLLRPVSPESGFGAQPPRPTHGAHAPASVVTATICSFDAPVDPARVEVFVASLVEAGSPALAAFVEEPSENTFPALPVRTGEHVVVWLQASQMDASMDLVRRHLPKMTGPPRLLRLEPTDRSQLR